MARRGLLLALVAATLSAAAPVRAENVSAEDAVKATFLTRFASFIAWPPESFSAPDAPIEICILGPAGFTAVVEHAASGQAINGHPLAVRALDDPASVRSCKIVYASGDATDEALHAAQYSAILTVTDAASRRGGRGIIHFVVVDSKIRFHIDDALAAESKLAVDSRLLSLALSVRRRQPS